MSLNVCCILTTEISACSPILTFILISIVPMFIFYLWQRTCLCLQYIQLYKVYLFLPIITCVSTCAISRHVCAAVQHTACACELSLQSVLAFALATFCKHTAVHIPHCDSSAHKSGILRAVEGYAPPTDCCCTQQLECALTHSSL